MDILMPNNPYAETVILSRILNDGDKIEDVLSIVCENDFYIDKHKVIFKAMKELKAKGINIDLVTLSNNLTNTKMLDKCGGITYLSQLSANEAFGENLIDHVKIVKDKSDRRKLIKAGYNLIESSQDKEIDQVLSNMESIIDSISDKNIDGKIISISDALQSTITNIEDKFNNGVKILGKTTGFKSLDNVTSGLQAGDFIVIAARPSMGKTAFALNIGQAASIDGSVAIFSLEMPQEQIMQRLLAAKCLVPLQGVKTGKLNENEFEKIMYGVGNLSTRKIFIDDNSMSLNDIKARCRKVKKTSGLDVVIIDYLQLLELNEKTHSREQEISKLSRELKKMAKQLNVAVVALSQLSRAPEQRNDKRPMLSDLRESGAIEQDADEVMLLYRDEYYNPDTENPGVVEINIAKNRNGEVKTVKLGWRGEYQRFGELC